MNHTASEAKKIHDGHPRRVSHRFSWSISSTTPAAASAPASDSASLSARFIVGVTTSPQPKAGPSCIGLECQLRLARRS